MECASSDKNGVSNINMRKKQRNKDNKRTAILDFDVLDCPVCFEPLTIPIFQCENGHLACSSCCPKLSKMCHACDLPIGHIRCRLMESVLSSISIPCPNAKFGCFDIFSYELESTHEKECLFSQCSCPALDCVYTGSYRNKSSTIRMNIKKKIKIKVDSSKKLLFVVQCFREPYGVCVTVSCIAPSAPEIGKFSYHLSYTVDGHTMTYKSPDIKRVLEVSFQTPLENFLFIPHSS
ncbi:hypothetical protein CARUB_v10003085mg [Capsella rubella]|uniref:RING-type E3 ubiquitin transferase n=1 Tax=Capsella rubella TaxID=81985 RepID=R0GZS6_9BRAS|nr:hypothetical protein CARUB_v10003085mg [Capsella rubella]